MARRAVIHLIESKGKEMYESILLIHSWVRWAVLISLLGAIFYAIRTGGVSGAKSSDKLARILPMIFVHTQFLLGLGLYFLSPIVQAFRSAPGHSMGVRELRYFGMEHITMMLLAVVILTIGSVLTKRRTDRISMMATMRNWYSGATVLILLGIPWSFLPAIGRPLFRF